MSLMLEISEELEQELRQKAAISGLSVQDYALRILEGRATFTTQPGTGAEAVAYWKRKGLIGTRTDITDSQAHARALRARAERRTRD